MELVINVAEALPPAPNFFVTYQKDGKVHTKEGRGEIGILVPQGARILDYGHLSLPTVSISAASIQPSDLQA